jgi:hypothetical protein
MADFVYNQAKGKAIEWAARVNANDPANSVLVIEAIASSATDAVLKDLDTFALIEADANTAEVAQSGYARKSLSDASGITITIDDTNDRTDVDCADQTWTAVASGGSAWTDLVFGYDSDSTGGTDANIVPISQHDFAITTDGSDVTAVIATAGFFRAS